MKNYRYMVFALFLACNTEQQSEFTFDELIGNVLYTTPFSVSDATFDVTADNSVMFTAEWEGYQVYELKITGRDSKNSVFIEGEGRELNETFDAIGEVPQFGNEICDAILSFPSKPKGSDTTILTLTNTIDYTGRSNHTLIDDFQDPAFPRKLVVSSAVDTINLAIESDLNTSYLNFKCVRIGKTGAPLQLDYTIANLPQFGGNNSLATNVTTTDAAELYFNFYIHSSQSDNLIGFKLIIFEDETGGSTKDESYTLTKSITPTSDWQLVSVPYNAFAFDRAVNAGSNSIREPSKISEFQFDFTVSTALNTGDEITVNVADFIITEGAPLSYP